MMDDDQFYDEADENNWHVGGNSCFILTLFDHPCSSRHPLHDCRSCSVEEQMQLSEPFVCCKFGCIDFCWCLLPTVVQTRYRIATASLLIIGGGIVFSYSGRAKGWVRLMWGWGP